MNSVLFLLYRLMLRSIAVAMVLAGLAVLGLMMLEGLSATSHTPEQWAMAGVMLLAMAAFTGFSWPLWRYAGRFPPQGLPVWLLWGERALLTTLVLMAGVQGKAALDFSAAFRPVLPAIALLVETRQTMTRWYQERGHWPEPGRELPISEKPSVASLTARSSGPGATQPQQELTATLAPALPESHAHRTIRMVTEDGGQHWRCLPGTLAPHLLPPSCR